MGRWPIKPTKVWEVYKEAVLDANRVVGLAISGDAQLVALASENISGPIHQVPLPGTNRVMDRGNSSHDLDITVHFVQPDEQELAAVSLERAGSSPWVLAVDDGPAASGEAVPLGPDSVRVSFKDTPEGWASVRAAVIDLADTASMSLACRYASFRPAVSRRVIEKTARQNAVVGAAFFFPGADMPVMTLNQLKMIFSLAAIHDQEISEDRALELAGTLGAGFGERDDELKVALAFPDAYEIGIANQALHILYGAAQKRSGVGVERAYLPWVDVIAEMRADDVPLLTWETWTPVRDAQVLGITLQHELNYTNVLELLDLARISVRSSHRGTDEPLVLGGGPAVANFAPLLPFLDAVVVGEGE